MMTSRVSGIWLAGSLGAPDARWFCARWGGPCILEDFERCQPSRRAHDAATRMRGRAAHIKVLDRRAELRVPRHGAQEEELLERQFALEDIAFAQAEFALQIQRREHLFVEDDVFKVGRIFGKRVDDIVAEGFALLIPVQTPA